MKLLFNKYTWSGWKYIFYQWLSKKLGRPIMMRQQRKFFETAGGRALDCFYPNINVIMSFKKSTSGPFKIYPRR